MASSTRRAFGAGLRERGSGEEVEKLYFESYSHVGIHQEMLQDRSRTEAYREAIFRNRSRIQNKVVMDVGCGTGVLSIFAAMAGAKKVYAVEAADIAKQAMEVAKCNGFGDVISVLHCKMEDVQIEGEVDVLVSEWMGYMLVYENMLPSLLSARDRFLRPHGLILPSSASIFLAPFTNEERVEESLSFWEDVYGINMCAFIPLAKKCYFSEPCLEPIGPENIMTLPCLVARIDCSTVTSADLECVTSPFKAKSMGRGPMHGVAVWFTVEFPVDREEGAGDVAPASAPATVCGKRKKGEGRGSRGEAGGVAEQGKEEQGGGVAAQASTANREIIVLSTAPEAPPTHWMQTLLYLEDPVTLQQDDEINGQICIRPCKDTPRLLTVELTCRVGEVEQSRLFELK